MLMFMSSPPPPTPPDDPTDPTDPGYVEEWDRRIWRPGEKPESRPPADGDDDIPF